MKQRRHLFMLQTFRNQRWLIALIFILALALLLRLYGITWGFPYIYHPDEDKLVRKAYRFGLLRDLNPQWFHYPALQMYVLFFVDILFVGAGFVIGRFSSLEDVSALCQDWQFFLLGRLTTVVFGIGTIVLTYFLGKAFFREKKIGLLAALFLSVVPLHVEESHYATTDVPMAFWTTATCLVAYWVYMTGQRKYYVIAGLTSGLAAATKYTVGLAIVIPAIAHLFRVETGRRSLLRRLFSGELVLSSACAAVAFLITNPFLFLNYEKALSDMRFEYLHAKWGDLGGPLVGSSWSWYLFKGLPAGLSLPLMLLSLSGLIYMLARLDKKAYILAIFPTLYLLFIGRWTVHWDRWLVPVAPFLLLFAAKLLFDLAVKFQSFPHATAAFMLITTILTLIPLSISLQFDHRLTLPDTRTISKAWVEANIPVGSKILMDLRRYSPPLSDHQYELRTLPRTVHGDQGHELPQESPEIDYYRREGCEYVIATSRCERYYQETTELLYPTIAEAYQAFYEELSVSASLLQVFEPQDGKIEGPLIKIYRLN